MKSNHLLILALTTAVLCGCASSPRYDRQPRDYWPPASSGDYYPPRDFWPPETRNDVRTGNQSNALVSLKREFDSAPSGFAPMYPPA